MGAAEESGQVLTKSWQWSRVSREDHARISGSTVGLDDFFYPGGEAALFPHDPGLSAKQSTGCSCYCTYGLAA